MQASVITNQLMEDNLLEKRAVLDRNPRSKRTWLAWLHLFLSLAGPRTSRAWLHNRHDFEMSYTLTVHPHFSESYWLQREAK